jgi:mannose-1-phosphate guanylyltransferase
MTIGVLGYTRKVAGDRRARSLRGLVLLAGSVRRAHMGSVIGRPVFDLPLEQGTTILDSWRREAGRLAETTGGGSLPIRIMLDRAAPEPSSSNLGATDNDGVPVAQVTVERDPFEYRGTGGVLRDLAVGYYDDDLLLVANASQVLMGSFSDLAMELLALGGDVGIVSHLDGTPSGTLLVRCGALRDLPAAGFVDMKEQALPAIARTHAVRVLERQRPTALPTRNLSEYVAALRAHHARLAGLPEEADPFAEDWESRFAIVEEGALKHPEARIHDSVVLRGGRLEAGAVVVQSLVCAGAEVRRGEMAVDSLVCPPVRNGQR